MPVSVVLDSLSSFPEYKRVIELMTDAQLLFGTDLAPCALLLQWLKGLRISYSNFSQYTVMDEQVSSNRMWLN
jgi:hypothetical protein